MVSHPPERKHQELDQSDRKGIICPPPSQLQQLDLTRPAPPLRELQRGWSPDPLPSQLRQLRNGCWVYSPSQKQDMENTEGTERRGHLEVDTTGTPVEAKTLWWGAEINAQPSDEKQGMSTVTRTFLHVFKESCSNSEGALWMSPSKGKASQTW